LTIAIVGHTTNDVITTASGGRRTSLGGTPLYARRALRSCGVEPTVVSKGPVIPGAVMLPGASVVTSVLHHRPDGTIEQRLDSIGDPFSEADVRVRIAPLLTGCEWVLLGGQSGGDFPPEAIAAIATAGRRVCLDAQGLARGDSPGPVRLRPIAARSLEGAAVVKLNLQEAAASGVVAADGSVDAAAVRRLGVPEVVVTRGMQGPVVITADAVSVCPAGTAHFDDPTGAGDSFSALYVLHRSLGAPPWLAAATASDLVERLYTRAQPAAAGIPA
jgi:sugar/nucleoside kinase (ribokinase family)